MYHISNYWSRLSRKPYYSQLTSYTVEFHELIGHCLAYEILLENSQTLPMVNITSATHIGTLSTTHATFARNPQGRILPTL